MQKLKIIIYPYNIEISTNKRITVLEALRRSGITLDAACGGRGICGKCRIRVLNGLVSPPTQVEIKMLKEEIKRGYRLACQVRARGTIEIEIPSFHGQILKWAPRLNVRILPRIASIPIREVSRKLPSDLDTILSKFKAKGLNVKGLELNAIGKLVNLLNEDSAFYAILDLKDMKILDFRLDERCYGIAVDLGTTTIVVSLVDIQRGEVVDTMSMYNEQLAYGRDIISRISYVMRNPKDMKILREALMNTINKLVRKLLLSHNVSPDAIYEIVAAGNTVMSCFFLGISPLNLGSSPFEPPFLGLMEISNRVIGVEANPEARVCLLPILGGYVGGDVAGDIISSGMLNNEKALLVDLGTNGEVVVKKGDCLFVASCAAGPAFEGIGVSSGMMAINGAIERVNIGDSSEISYSVIGNVKPRGICGSGLIDVLAEFLKAGIIDTSGRFKDLNNPRIRKRNDILEYVIEWAENTSSGADIVITQRDIRQLQLAKAAVKAAWTILLKKANISPDDLEAVYVAGGFGNFLNSGNAMLIGLIPKVEASKVHFIGNGSLAGAQMYLLSVDVREQVNNLLQKVVHVELNLEPEFHKLYLKSLSFT